MAIEYNLIETAIKEVGYRETPVNITKYNEWADDNNYWFTKVQGCSWCTTFIAWCIEKAYPIGEYDWELNDFCIDDNCCWSDHWMNNFKTAGRFFTLARPGDLAFTKGHVGIVRDIDSQLGTILTIEGNRNDMVIGAKSLESQWLGFGRPNWNSISKIIQPITDPEEIQAKMWAINQGIMIGREDGDMDWKDYLTREEASLILYRFWKKWHNEN